MRASETPIDPFYNPLEEMIIQMTRETITATNSLIEQRKNRKLLIKMTFSSILTIKKSIAIPVTLLMASQVLHEL